MIHNISYTKILCLVFLICNSVPQQNSIYSNGSPGKEAASCDREFYVTETPTDKKRWRPDCRMGNFFLSLSFVLCISQISRLPRFSLPFVIYKMVVEMGRGCFLCASASICRRSSLSLPIRIGKIEG